MNPVDLRPQQEPGPTLRWRLALVALIGFLVGLGAGYQMGYTVSLGGLEGIAAAFIGLMVGVVALVLGVVGIGAGFGRRWTLRLGAFLAAGMLVLGTVAGNVAVSAFDLGYKPPVSLQGIGSGSIVLDVAGFEPTGDGEVTCRSVDDSMDVGSIQFDALGELNGGTLRSWIDLPHPGRGGGFIELIIDGADLPEGSAQPTWSGSVQVTVTDGGVSGSGSFSALGLRLEPLDAAPTSGWPATLTGEVTWQCQPWQATGGPGSIGWRGIARATYVDASVGPRPGRSEADFRSPPKRWTISGFWSAGSTAASGLQGRRHE